MKEITWKYWKFGRLTIRTNNQEFGFGFEWRTKSNGVYDFKISSNGIKAQWLPF